MSFRSGRLRASELVHAGEVLVEADVVVVGAGAGGCALAAAVAEHGGTVVLLEEGRHWEPSDFRRRSP
jgi:choline dehydrogenase-like flavoprotein